MSADCYENKVSQTKDAQHKPRSRLTAILKRIETNSDLTVAKPTRLAIILTKIEPSTSTEATRRGLAISKSVSGYLSLPAQPFVVDFLHTYMFNTDCKYFRNSTFYGCKKFTIKTYIYLFIYLSYYLSIYLSICLSN